ncbi:T9SS type A sorting domain-containing protein [uncultured Winogradskyella sp.]|uniref:T9SS type A sorting domain-containing protein n=1 Tax=uncultured Winogradskyella sp. TaxID=395353 RepID=UPI00343B6E49
MNISNQFENVYNIEIFNLSGQQILTSRPFNNNTINTSSFSRGLYFIRLSNLNNQQKIFKFLKN